VPSGERRFHVLLGVATILLLPWVFASWRPGNPDVSWLMHVADRMLDGARYGRDVIEINPPLIAWPWRTVVSGGTTMCRSTWRLEPARRPRRAWKLTRWVPAKPARTSRMAAISSGGRARSIRTWAARQARRAPTPIT